MSAPNNTAKITTLSELEPNIQDLLKQAVEARKFAYCPYSHFQVGASLLDTEGTVHTGCNIENSSFSPTICAERTAYAKAISQGIRTFKAIAVIAESNQGGAFTTPCGLCRQFMSEFGNVEVFNAKPDLKEILVTDINHILPYQFRL